MENQCQRMRVCVPLICVNIVLKIGKLKMANIKIHKSIELNERKRRTLYAVLSIKAIKCLHFFSFRFNLCCTDSSVTDDSSRMPISSKKFFFISTDNKKQTNSRTNKKNWANLTMASKISRFTTDHLDSQFTCVPAFVFFALFEAVSNLSIVQHYTVLRVHSLTGGKKAKKKKKSKISYNNNNHNV